MSKISLTNLVNLNNQTTAVNAINANNAAITTALEKTLSRDGTIPNQMSASLDMNSQQILNLPDPATSHSPLRLLDLTTFLGGSVTFPPLQFGVSVKNFGAVCDGVTDDTAAINTALSSGRLVYLPDAATCKITGVLNITVSGTGLIGGGWNSSIITSTSTTANMINIAANVNNVVLSGFKLTRSVSATASAQGINFAGNTEQTQVSDIYIEKQYEGMICRTTNYSVIRNVQSVINNHNGFLFVDTATSGICQWYLYGNRAQSNASCGFQVLSGAGTNPVSLGNWSGIYTLANTANGIGLFGSALARIQNFRLSDSYISQDGASEIYLDTFSTTGVHNISNTTAELAGTGLTGPAGTTPASNVGSGVEVTANNVIVRLDAVVAHGNKQNGFSMSATEENNVSGCRGSSNTLNGIVLTSGLTSILTGSKFINNAVLPISITGNGTSLISSGNSPLAFVSTAQSLGSNIALNNTANYFDGPGVTLGQGTWLVTGTVSVRDSAGAADFFAKLWDGITPVASARITTGAANFYGVIPLSGVFTATNGTVAKISCRDATSVNGSMDFNATGNSRDSTITAIKIG